MDDSDLIAHDGPKKKNDDDDELKSFVVFDGVREDAEEKLDAVDGGVDSSGDEEGGLEKDGGAGSKVENVGEKDAEKGGEDESVDNEEDEDDINDKMELDCHKAGDRSGCFWLLWLVIPLVLIGFAYFFAK